jgi:CubicO group peptidase (beta-lactamase class C family)
MTNKYLFTIILACGTLYAPAQDINKPKLDSLLNAVALKHEGMGSLAIAYNGQLVYQKAIGYANIINGRDEPASIHTKYRIGSISKMFTAVMIFQLIEENKLQLNTKLSAFFPKLPDASKITISMMLGHRSGLHNFTNDSAYLTYYTKPHTEADMLAIIGAAHPDFEPDTKASYSNTNFVLLGYIIEKLDGKTYPEVLKRRIIAKIGLNETYYGRKMNKQAGEAASYQYTNNTWVQQPETDMSIPGGAGGIVSTPSDLVKFIDALFAGRLISAEHLAMMKTIRDGYGMAMFRIPFYDKISYGHTGGIDGFSSVLGYFPDEKMAFAYCGNGVVYSVNNILIGVLSIYFDKPYTIPPFKTSPAKELAPLLGNYSNMQLPLKITVTNSNGVLTAQATGQSAFELEAIGNNKFKYEPAGILMEFDPDDHSFLLKQGGGTYKFILDK